MGAACNATMPSPAAFCGLFTNNHITDYLNLWQCVHGVGSGDDDVICNNYDISCSNDYDNDNTCDNDNTYDHHSTLLMATMVMTMVATNILKTTKVICLWVGL